MIDTPIRAINDVIADFLACKPSDEEVLSYFMPPDLQARVHFLLDLNGEGELTAEEKLELDEFIRADEFMSMLKTNTRLKLRKLSK